MGIVSFGKYALAALSLVLLMGSCDKEPRKVDVNDGNENPSVRKLIVEMTHRYSNVADSLLPGVAITLFDNEDELLRNNFTRSDTTGVNGTLTFQQMNAGTYIVLLNHKTLGTKRQQVNIANETVVSYEYWYY